MKFIFFFLLAFSVSSIKISWSELNSMSSGNNYTGGNNVPITTLPGNMGSNNMSNQWTLITDSSMVGGQSVSVVVATYIKQLAMSLMNNQNEIRVVRIEKDCTGKYYKILIRVKDCNGNVYFIGMLVYICNGEIKFKKYLQTDCLGQIMKVFKFIDNNLYNYPDGDQGQMCGNSIISILKEICVTIGTISNNSNNSNNNGLLPLNNNGGSSSGMNIIIGNSKHD